MSITMDATKVKPAFVRMIWLIVSLLVLIGIAIVVRRTLALFFPSPAASGFQQGAALDANFARQRLLTMVHIIPGLLFVLLAPLQFVRALRNRRPRLHRWMGRIVLASGAVIGITALVMSPQMAIGGLNETVATMLFAILFLFALAKGFASIRRGNVALHREWMIRAFAIGMAVATIRPIMGVFFATSRLTHLTPHDFFGTAFWLGFTVQSIVAEVWINYTRPRISVEATSRATLKMWRPNEATLHRSSPTSKNTGMM
jgi:uncharacterized membrane protein